MRKKVKKKNRVLVPPRMSMKLIEEVHGIDIRILKLAKRRGFPGFQSGNKIMWEVLGPMIEKHKEELEQSLKGDKLGLSDELKKRDLRIKDLKIRKLEGLMLDPMDVKKLLVELATTISIVIKKEAYELVPRIVGLPQPGVLVEVNKMLMEIFKVLKSGQAMLEKMNEPA